MAIHTTGYCGHALRPAVIIFTTMIRSGQLIASYSLQLISSSDPLHINRAVIHSINFGLNSRSVHLRDLVIRVMPRVAPDWYNLGLQLISEDEVRIVEADCLSSGVEVACRKMFSKWLMSDPQASWRRLVEALRAISHHTVANDIKKWLLPSQGEPPMHRAS